jgi:hypothetical protein
MSNRTRRRYVAHAVEDHGRGSHLVPEAASFVEAAVMFAEHWHPTASDDGAVSVTVVDCDSGEQHCFTIDIDSGDVEPCAA